MEIAIANSSAGRASTSNLGFIGGSPLLPPGFAPPLSKLTGVAMAFMFQVFFPPSHALAGKTLVLFLAIDGVTEELIIPPMSCGELSRVVVTENVLAAQQVLHGVFVFDIEEVEPAPHVASPVEYKQLVVATGADIETGFGSLEDSPRWILEDETPGDFSDGRRAAFCLQTVEYLKLPRRSDAPPQAIVDYFDPNGKGISKEPFYEMFAGNAIFYFSYPNQQKVVVVVQGD
jgi:hypothetical protein